MGSFREDYVGPVPGRASCAAGKRSWPSPPCGSREAREELAVDLMRQPREAPAGVMEYLFTRLMLWGAAQGYRWFNLGVAPLSGLPSHELAPLWSRAANLLYHRGGRFYNFAGLRAFKQKFDPAWEPRYIAGAARPRPAARRGRHRGPRERRREGDREPMKAPEARRSARPGQRTTAAAREVLGGRRRPGTAAAPPAVPRPGLHRQRGLRRPRQLRHQHPGRRPRSATPCSG